MMNSPNRNMTDYTYLDAAQSTQQVRNKVLRNTYWLLALSLVPTVIGAFIGLQFGLFRLSPMMSMIIFFVGAFGFIFAIEKTKNSNIGVVILLAFTFFMGVMLSRMLGFVLYRYSNGAELIALAFGGTALVFLVMASLATVIKRDLSAMGKWLFVGLIMLIVGMVANFFLQSSALMITISVLCVGIFSAWILYDVKRIIDGGETNYITATLSIYISLYNIFQNLLALLGIFGGED